MQFSRPEENIAHIDLKKGDRVADFGTGTGAYALALARVVGDTGRVYACDVQKELLHKVKREAEAARVRTIEIVWSDLDIVGGSKLGGASVDAVVIANLLFQSEHRQNLLREAHRILKSHGQVLVVDWQGSFGGIGPHPDQVVTEEQGKQLLGATGFSFKKAFLAGTHHWGLVYSK